MFMDFEVYFVSQTISFTVEFRAAYGVHPELVSLDQIS